jgi:hypothetical protein
LAGFTKKTNEQLFDIGLVRYNPDGLVDPTFGPFGTGRVITDIRGAGDDARAIALQPDLENTTGDHTKNSSSDRGNGMAIQPDGKIVVVGLTDAPVANANSNYGVVRYLP